MALLRVKDEKKLSETLEKLIKAIGELSGTEIKVRKRTYPADRAAPFDDATRRFLVRHLRDTRDMVAPHLDADALARLDAHIDPDGEKSFVRRPDAEVTCLTGLYLGQK